MMGKGQFHRHNVYRNSVQKCMSSEWVARKFLDSRRGSQPGSAAHFGWGCIVVSGWSRIAPQGCPWETGSGRGDVGRLEGRAMRMQRAVTRPNYFLLLIVFLAGVFCGAAPA